MVLSTIPCLIRVLHFVAEQDEYDSLIPTLPKMPSAHCQHNIGNLQVHVPVLQEALEEEQVFHGSIGCGTCGLPGWTVDKHAQEYGLLELFHEVVLQLQLLGENWEFSQYNALWTMNERAQERCRSVTCTCHVG